MEPYADYEFYIEKYNGKAISEENFAVASLHASQFIRYVTMKRSDDYHGDKLKYATCAVAEAYNSAFHLSSDNSSRGEIKSENTDGYSVSYAVQSNDGETAEALFKRKAYDDVKYWLAGTGLLDRRCGIMRY